MSYDVSPDKVIELRKGIQSMVRGDALYTLLKEELSALGHWKCLPRGNPKKGRERQVKTLSGVEG
jgi:hypothetical protein